jgi:hypothetical protein
MRDLYPSHVAYQDRFSADGDFRHVRSDSMYSLLLLFRYKAGCLTFDVQAGKDMVSLHMCFGLDKFTAHRLFEDDIAGEGFVDEAKVNMTLTLLGFW